MVLRIISAHKKGLREQALAVLQMVSEKRRRIIIAYAFQLIGYGLIFPMNKKRTAEVAAELAARKAK